MNPRTSTAPAPIYPGEPPRRSRLAVLFVVLALLAVAAGVVVVVNLTSDDDHVATKATQESPAPPPTLPADPQAATKAAVIAAYEQSYKAIIVVGKEASPDLNDPRLSQHTTGPALTAMQRSLADNKSKGLVYVGDAELHPMVIELGADTATVVDCSYDRTGLVEARTGRVVVDPGPPEAGASTAKLKLDGGVWKVTDFKDEKRTCVPPAG